jgi:hypothetical protein
LFRTSYGRRCTLDVSAGLRRPDGRFLCCEGEPVAELQERRSWVQVEGRLGKVRGTLAVRRAPAFWRLGSDLENVKSSAVFFSSLRSGVYPVLHAVEIVQLEADPSPPAKGHLTGRLGGPVQVAQSAS